MAAKKKPAKRAPVKKAGRKAGPAPLVAQPHGGRIWQGAPANPVAGTGRPPSILRERLRGSFEQRIGVLEDIADGEPVVSVHVETKNGDGAEIKIPAAPSDRIRAIDTLAKYGLGTTKEITVEDVRGKLAATLDVIRASLAPELAAQLIHAIRPIWVADAERKTA